MGTLKPSLCPFCCSEDVFVECMDFGEFAAVCNHCSAHGPRVDGDGCDPDGENARGKRNALRAWNKRPKSGRARITALEEEGKS